MKAISLRLTTESINAAIAELQAYKRWVQERAALIAERLAQYGLIAVRAGYGAAAYDGTKYYNVDVVQTGDYQYEIVASGKTVLILEFGSGVIAGVHPLNMYGAGTYPGQTHVPDPGYWFYSDGGTSGHYSRGNPASAVMYETGKNLRDRVLEVAREVFAS